MKVTTQPMKPRLVRTTVRLPVELYRRLKRRSVDEGRPLQALVISDLEGAEKQQAFARAEEIFKFQVRLKKGQRLPTRAELYDEILDHRVRSV
jgi:predicted DNA-binding protein